MFALLLFGWRIARPLVYEADGIFQCSSDSTGPMSGVLSKILGENSPTGSSSNLDGDPKAILTSRTLMERVVKKLHLQADLRLKNEEGIFSRVKKNLLAEYAYYFYKKRKRPLSAIIPKNIIIPDIEVIKEELLPFACRDISYDRSTFTSLTLRFTPNEGFAIYDSLNRYLGSCKAGEPFEREGTRFTLLPLDPNPPAKTQTFTLTLLPLSDVANALKNTLKVKKDIESKALLKITYSSSDKYLAASLVNTLMREYQEYLEKLSETKKNEHLAYLQMRKKQTGDEFLILLQEQRAALKKSIEEGGFVVLDHEIDFLDKRYAQDKAAAIELESQIQRMDEALSKNRGLAPAASLEAALLRLKENSPSFVSECEGLDVEGARMLLIQSTKELDALSLEIEHYRSLIEAIPEPSFEVSHLASILNDPSLREFYIKTHENQLALLDPKNWSSKEKERIKSDLETTKAYLISHLKQLERSSLAKHHLIQEKIDNILFYLLHLQANLYEKTLVSLKNISRLSQSFPDKWTSEKLISLNTDLSITLIESLSKVIESKNLSHFLKNYESRPLVLSTIPALPLSPHLRLFLIAGFFGGAALLLFSAFLLSLLKGPRVSYESCRALEIPVFSQESQSFASDLFLFLEKHPDARKIAIVTTAQLLFLPLFFKKLEEEGQSYASIELPPNSSSKKIEAIIQRECSCRFIFLRSEAPIDSIAFSHLENAADLILFETRQTNLKPFLLHSFSKPWGFCLLPPQKKEFLPYLKEKKLLFAKFAKLNT